MNEKILLVTAPYRCWGVQAVGSWPPLHLAYLAGAAREAGAVPRIYDAMNESHSYPEIAAEIARFQPDYVLAYDYLPVTGAISTATVPAAIEILKLAKELDSGIVTLLGGPHPTFLCREVLESARGAVDYVLVGEGEATLKALLQALRGGTARDVKGIAYFAGDKVVVNAGRAQISDLDELAPAWDLLRWESYSYRVGPGGRMASILTSRGCEMSCSFCSQRLFWRGAWRARKPEKVVDEVVLLREKYGVEVFTLIDAYPTRDRGRWERLLDLLIAKNLGLSLLMETRVEDIVRDADILDKYRKAGVIHVYVGAESGDDAVLRGLNKGIELKTTKRALELLNGAGIVTEASFMIGFPEETRASVRSTIDAAIYLNPDVAVFPIVTPWPYTPMYREVKDRIRVFDHAKYNLVTPIIEPFKMSLEEVSQALATCYMEFYAHKLKQVFALEHGFKRDYLMSAFRLMMRDRCSAFKMKGLEPHHHPYEWMVA
jgi:anaerobic magnesium-protoporphyrin IX monomethyl ester cyclase